MTTTTYDDALRTVQQLTSEERRRLQHDLETRDSDGPQPMTAVAKRAKTLAVLDNLDRLATEIATEWTDEMNAVDAVHDVRRDL